MSSDASSDATTLTDRLRGIYTLPVKDGAGPLNGKYTFTRNFETSPIMHEAADEIDRLRMALETIAHDHAQHAYLLSRCQENSLVASIVRGSMSVALGWAQGIAREALNEPQNEFTRHFQDVRESAHADAKMLQEQANTTNGQPS